MQIAIIVDRCAPFYVGGYEDRYWNVAARLAARHDVRVYTSLRASTQAYLGVEFHSLLPPAFLDSHPFDRSIAHSMLYSASLLGSPFGSWVPDIVIVEAIPYLHLASIRHWLVKGPWLRVLNVNEAWWHYSYLEGLLSGATRFGVRGLLSEGLRWSDLTVAISGATATSLTENFHASSVHVVPMGIDDALAESPILPRPPAVAYDFISVGRLAWYKRNADFVAALALLKRNFGWDGRAAIVGSGPCLGPLIRQARNLDLQVNLDFLGPLDNDAKLTALASSRVFVLPSEREGFSLATLEAMAMGLPSIVSEPPFHENFGVSELVRDGRTGIMYPCGDSAKLAECCHKLLRSPEDCNRFGKEAKETARHYGWNQVVMRFEELLNSARRSDAR